MIDKEVYDLTQTGDEVQAILNNAEGMPTPEQLSEAFALKANVSDVYTKNETYTKSEVNRLVGSPEQNYVTVDDYASLPATGRTDTIYRVANYDGENEQVDVTKYSEYAWNGTSYTLLCVKSQIGEVFDISDYNDATYANLSAALGADGANVPQSIRRGGMSIKFIQSSDNKYLQYRCIADEFTTDVTQWAIADEGVYIENPEFVYVMPDAEDKILFGFKRNGEPFFGVGCPQQVKDYIEEKIAKLSLDKYEDIVTFLVDYLGSDTTLKVIIDGINAAKVDKEEGKSLIDAEYASSQSATDNPEFLDAKTDAEGKILEGIRKDGTKIIGGDLIAGGSAKVLGEMELAGVTYKVVENSEFIAAWLDAEDKIIFGFKSDGKTYVGDADFLNDMDDIKAFLQNIIDKNIDWDALSSITSVEYLEFIDVETDSEGKILSSRDNDGVKKEYVGFETPNVSIDGHTIENIKDPEERSEITTDFEGKIISYRDSDGVKHEEVGIETNHLILTKEGMSDFQQALRDSGFQPGGSGDFSGKDSMYISEPILAHLNIITDFDLTTLSKTSDVPVTLEFYDGAGNYFKKYGILNGQGRSSLYFIKKGLNIDFFNENPASENFDDDNTFSIKFGDWVAQDSFHCKSYYTDYFRATTAIVYKLADEVLKTRGIMDDRPYKRYYTEETQTNGSVEISLKESMDSGARCISDGFPVIVYQNDKFWGVNSLQLKKHRDNYQMKKSKDSNILLDCGESWIGFISSNGNIDWDALENKATGIEIRNPKDLYCTNGKKYKSETNQKELITTATAEEWIDAGVTPRGDIIDDKLASNLRLTGKVRKNLEDFTKYTTEINSVISGGATTDDIRSAISERFDVKSLIDYILLVEITNNTDAYANNIIVSTWGKPSGSNKQLWSINLYDCDVTFGTSWRGDRANSPSNNRVLQNGYYPYVYIFRYYLDELKARYKELRDNNIFTAEHITNLFKQWMDRVGYDNYDKEYTKWNESPCFREGGCNNGWTRTSENYVTSGYDLSTQYNAGAIVQYNYRVYKSKIDSNTGHTPVAGGDSYWDDVSWSENKSYSVGDTCYYGKWQMYPFEATAASTNVPPLKQLYTLFPGELGFYGSIYRIYKFMIEEIQLLDNQLNYNVN